MKTIRRRLRGGTAGGAMVIALAYLLILQAALAGIARGAMAAAEAGPLHVICTPSGLSLPDGGGDRGIPGEDDLHRHCAALCLLASSTGAMPPAVDTAVPAPARRVAVMVAAPSGQVPTAPRGALPEARAPPSSI